MILIYADGEIYLLDPREIYDPFPLKQTAEKSLTSPASHVLMTASNTNEQETQI